MIWSLDDVKIAGLTKNFSYDFPDQLPNQIYFVPTKKKGLTIISDVDTRALVRYIR
jgi:carbamoylphosphate synthase small subunit